MSHASDTLVIGKIGAPYGVKGWVKITSYTEELSGIFDYSPWVLGENGKEYKVDHWRPHNKALIAKLVGVDNRDEAEAIKNLDIIIKAEQLPQLEGDEYYWRDLVDMQVVTDKGYDLGVVKELFATGANDVMLVKARTNDAFGQKERMIPYLFDDVIKQVDMQTRTIKVDWDPGF
ncbi:ribosome maturation factor RimM [Aestuariibacter sp. AA17]|uniref:Ribosome maturation factor RimM n=1 Tax=Fluctibacter corallii TaxID=2984329 RepID=A0ABT3AAG6_9ALTE|nr:ribosome maturation factor RimM [Aestuariibacter sp. AA17]MCV2885587.1 ribosome maturation factor RimM [Aestuariibacter sp. AA17]